MSSVRTHTSANSPAAGLRAPGLYRGIVTSVDDSLQIARVKVTVNELGGNKELAWAPVLSPLSGNLSGMPWVPAVDARVLVLFEANDINRPVVVGAVWRSQGEESDAPKAARGETDDVRGARGSDTATGAGGASLQEPSDPFGADYPDNYVLKIPKAGHLIEYDATEGAERISITHGKKKTWIEMHPDGGLVVGVKGKRYVLVDEDDQKHVKGKEDVVVDSDATHKAAKFERECTEYKATVNGPHTENITGNVERTIQGSVTEDTTGSVERSVTGSVKDEVTGAVERTITGAVQEEITGTYDTNVAGPRTLIAPIVNVQGAITNLGPAPSGNVVTTVTHPVDYITGLPILGVVTVLA